MSVRIAAAAVTTMCLFAGNSWCIAQPLVTGDLSVYYSFDSVDEDGIWPDGSGNELHGLTTLGFEDADEDDLDDIRLDTSDKKRGTGAAWFATDPEIKEDYIAVCDPVNQPDHNDGCGEFLDDRPAYVPSNAFTLSAWLKVEDVGQDHSIWQSRAGGGGFIHTQIQGNGNVRFRLRGDGNGDNLVQYNEPPGGDFVEFEEWIHFAGTYDGGGPDDFGEFAIYYNGEEAFRGEANGNVAGDPDFGILGDWAQGGFVGLVPDFARQLVGKIDEFYLFSRALSEEEIGILYNPVDPPGVPGDYNNDGTVDAADADAQSVAMKDANPDLATFDENGDAAVNFQDRVIWAHDHAGTWIGDSNFDGEFNSGDLVDVFGAGKYDTGQMANWSEGDWSGDMIFDSGDLVVAFGDGGFEAGPFEPALAAVPEPASLAMLSIGLILFVARRRR